jgi:hypothetical protein
MLDFTSIIETPKMSTNFDRFRVRRAVASPLAIPKVPTFPEQSGQVLKTAVWEALNRSFEQWRQMAQTSLEQAIMALKLDPGDIDAQIATYIEKHPIVTHDPTKVDKSGDTMTGQLTLANVNPSRGLDAVCADYVNSRINKSTVTLDSEAEKVMTMDGQRVVFDKQTEMEFFAGPIAGDSHAPEFRTIRLTDLLNSFATFTPIFNRTTGKYVEAYVLGDGDTRQLYLGNEFDAP